LSPGLYESPASCLKELVNNSFDADATEVLVFVKPDANRIIVQDNGHGMSRAEFERHFKRIAESHKRDDSEETASGRKKIGKIGIGVVAANELCEKLEIFSTQRGSTELLHVIIDFEEMKKPPEQRKRDGDDFVKADYYGSVDVAESVEHFTHMFLTNIKGQARHILAGAETEKEGANALSIYGKKIETIEKLLKTNINTWSDFDFYSKTVLEIALNVPVQYFDGWVPARLKKQVKPFEERTKKLNFTVKYDGVPLRKPIVFKGEPSFIQPFSFQGEHVKAEGYFYAQHGQIRPRELHGLLVRIRDAAVGDFDSSFWGFSASEYSLIQRWVSCEIWADDRLEEAMNIDRRTLRVTHPAYVELRNAIHTELRSIFSRTRDEIYESGSEERKVTKALSVSESVTQVIHAPAWDLDPSSKREMTRSFNPSRGEKARNLLTKKFTLPEVLSIIIEVATEVLSSKQRAEFLRKITERLNRG
jgi:hypothetical protein